MIRSAETAMCRTPRAPRCPGMATQDVKAALDGLVRDGVISSYERPVGFNTVMLHVRARAAGHQLPQAGLRPRGYRAPAPPCCRRA